MAVDMTARIRFSYSSATHLHERRKARSLAARGTHATAEGHWVPPPLQIGGRQDCVRRGAAATLFFFLVAAAADTQVHVPIVGFSVFVRGVALMSMANFFF